MNKSTAYSFEEISITSELSNSKFDFEMGFLSQKNGIKTADVKLYMGDRHELFFEENSDTVIQELIDWIENVIQVSK